MSVNISARHLIDSDLEATVLAALRDSGLPGSSLVLEITESTAVDDPGHARDLLDRLRQHGVRVAIDNIGTGYSSLGYLNRLPAATLKIDRSMVVDVTEKPDSFAVAAAIIDLARAIRLTTMAEGIETREQLGLLRRLGCAAGQGLLWSAALPPAQLLVQLAALRGGHFDVSVPDSLTPAPRRPKAREVVTVEHGVHRMLRLHDDGASLNTIAAALNAEGFRTPAGQRWHRVTVARAITDVAYPHLDEAPR